MVRRVITISDYRRQLPVKPENGFRVEIEPPYIIVRHCEEGVIVREECVLSEFLLREMIEHGSP